MTKILIPLIAIAVFSPVPDEGQSEERSTQSKTVEMNLGGKDLASFRAECDQGRFRLVGKSDADRVEVIANVVVRGEGADEIDLDRLIEERIELSLSEKKRHGILVSKVLPGDDLGPISVSIDLSVVIPARLDSDIQQGTGSVDIAGLEGRLALHDGSGSVRIADIAGDVEVKDGSGSLTVSGVSGDLDIEDGSGGLTAKSIGGSVTISDGSGGIDVLNIGGDVRIVEAGSGSVSVKNVGGKVHGVQRRGVAEGKKGSGRG